MALKVLQALDAAKTQWYHFRAIIIAGMGFFTDAYDLFCIPPVTKLLGRLYYYDPGSDQPGSLPLPVNAVVNGIALCGALVGQLYFGWLGDRMGRKKVYGMTLTLMVVSSIASAFSFGSSAKAVMTSLCFFRFWLGFGIGGDYPLSATIMSEYANKKTRGSFIAAVFAMQGFGILAASAVTLTVSAAFHGAYPTPPFQQHSAFNPSTPRQADYVWRIILLLGAAPAALTYYWRMQMPETARYTALVARNTEQAAVDMSRVLRLRIEEDHTNADMIPGRDASYGLFSKEFARQHGRHLLGTTVTWFLLDIAFYSSNLYQSQMYTAVGKLPAPRDMSALEEVLQMARLQAIVALCSTMPGYLFTVALIDRIGRFRIQLLGFIFMTVFIFVLAIPREHYWREHNKGFVAVYSLTFFFSNFGPNCTTFIIPAELFPARLRSTCHGISAAAGKAGAIIGAFGFLYAGHRIGVSKTLIILGITCCLGIFFTYYFTPETNGRSLEENEEEIVESETRRSNGHESEEA